MLDEERAEDLVATMQDVVGFAEEATAGFVLHARISRIGRVTFPQDQGSMVGQIQTGSKEGPRLDG